MKKIAVILSGCGVYDGAEIHEAAMTLLAIARHGAEYQCFAPDIPQYHVVNHTNGEVMNESRNVLVESARIARGNIKPLSELKVSDFDAIVFPGGFGVAKNLCTFAFDGADCKVEPEAARVITETHKAGKPIGALCIAPVLVTKVLSDIEVTIGDDEGTAAAIVDMGGKHVNKAIGEIVIDANNKIVTSPCYMLDATIDQIADSADKVIRQILAMV